MNLSAEFKSVRDRSFKNGEIAGVRLTEHPRVQYQPSVLTVFMTGSVGGEQSLTRGLSKHIKLKGLILAQNERWRRGLGMQVVRESPSGEDSGERESNGWLHTLRTGIASGN